MMVNLMKIYGQKDLEPSLLEDKFLLVDPINCSLAKTGNEKLIYSDIIFPSIFIEIKSSVFSSYLHWLT